MADLSDVSVALLDLVNSAVYPTGLSNPSVADVDIRIYDGWPIPANLDADLSAGIANISVYPTTMERVTTRFPTDWQQSTINPVTLTLTVNDTISVTVSGTITSPQTCMVIVNGVGFAYAVQANDSLTTIAINLAALIPGATSSGPEIFISGAYRLSANVSVPGIGIRELKRQERVFMITTWAATDPIRTSIVSAIDILFAATERFVLPDNFYARLKYHSSPITDMMEKQKLYRRNLLYTVEYATTQTETEYTISQAYLNSLEVGPTGQVQP